MARSEAAAKHALPRLIVRGDVRGDLHMHTTESDGSSSIREMAEAAIARGLEYIAITDHSKNLAMTNGMDDVRALAHARRIRAVSAIWHVSLPRARGRSGLAMSSGCATRSLSRSSRQFPFACLRGRGRHPDGWVPDLADETLAELDIVVASVHSGFSQTAEEVTARVLRAAENPHVNILGHPTGRKVLKREPYKIDIGQLLAAAARLGVAVEHNAAPARSDLSDLHLRMAKELGCKIVVNTDAHTTGELDQIDHGIVQLRRAWLSPADVLNTLPLDGLLAGLRRA